MATTMKTKSSENGNKSPLITKFLTRIDNKNKVIAKRKKPIERKTLSQIQMSSDERRLTRDDKENTGLKKKKRKIGDVDDEDENAEKQRKTARIDQTNKPFKIYIEPQKSKVAATAKSYDLVEKSSQTEATRECTCTCTSAPSSHNSETPGGEKDQTEGSSSKLQRDEEGERSCADTGEKSNTEGSKAETSSGEDSKPEETQKTPEEEAYDLMVNEEIPEDYWKDLAEERRKALDESLVENEQLHHKVRDLEEEKEKLTEMASQAEYFASMLKKLTEDEEESHNSTDNHDNDGAADVSVSTASEAEDSDINTEHREDDVTTSEEE